MRNDKIIVSETDVRVSEILSSGDHADFEQLLAAKVLLEDQISKCKVASEMLTQALGNRTYGSVVSELQSRGILSPSDDTLPMFEIQTKFGDSVKISVSSGTETKYDLSRLKDKGVFDGLPDKYKKISTTLDARAVESAYESGALEDLLSKNVIKTVRPVLKLRKSVTKTKEGSV